MMGITAIETARKNRKSAVAYLARRKGQAPRRPRPASVESSRLILFRDVMVMMQAYHGESGAFAQADAGRRDAAHAFA